MGIMEKKMETVGIIGYIWGGLYRDSGIWDFRFQDLGLGTSQDVCSYSVLYKPFSNFSRPYATQPVQSIYPFPCHLLIFWAV